MYERKYYEREDKVDNSLVYSHQEGWVKFFKHSKFYYCTFSTKQGYEAFVTSFQNKEKKGAAGDCLERYVINGGCVACD